MKNIFRLILLLGCSSCIYQANDADLVIHNANIYTNNYNNDKYQALAVSDGKIMVIGAEREVLNKYKGKVVIDAQGAFVYPGFIDAHCHFFGLGRTLQVVNLQGVKSLKEFKEVVVAFHQQYPKSWIYGRGWDESLWENQSIPDISFLDSLFPNTPVYLKRVDGHSAIINSVVQQMAGIDVNTKVEGGQFAFDKRRFTGRIVDRAMELIDSLVPSRTKELDVKALLKAQKVCFSEGLTAVTDAGLDVADIKLIDSLQENGELKIPMNIMVSDNKENKDFFFANGPIQKERMQVNSFKFYADGSLGSRSAKLKEHYHDHDSEGMLMEDKPYFLEQAKLMEKYGFQMNTHCIGDSAVSMMLDVYGQVLKNTNDKRWRIEHAQVLDSQDFVKFSKYSVIPSVQPTHAISDRRWAKDRLGEERMAGAYAYKKLLATNGILAFGTDFPVEKVSPLRTFYAAVYRKEPGENTEGWRMEEALTRREALNGMTLGAAIANHQDSLYGSIEIGKYANFTILDTDLFKDSEKRIANAKVLQTIVHGEVVFTQIR